MNRIATLALLLLCSTAPLAAAQQQPAQPKPGIPAVQLPFASLKPTATFKIGATADWVQVTNNAVWVTGSNPFSVERIDPATNKIVARIKLPGEACAGLAFGFGSLWVPVCGSQPALARVDVRTNRIAAVLPIGPAGAEAGIAAGGDSVWVVTDKAGTTLSRINPATNTVRQQIKLPPGSYNPLYAGNTVWVTGFDKSVLTAIDASTGKVFASIPVGPHPRFLTAGGNSLWTLNQGDGSLTRIDLKSRKVIATIALGIPGTGGDIGYGADSVWVTTLGLPLTVIHAPTNRVVRQWVGPGGDALRFGHGSIWLTDYRRGLLCRIPLKAALQR
jgi:YVTN family beta-propeller protein